jgi:hypothetical protein
MGVWYETLLVAGLCKRVDLSSLHPCMVDAIFQIPYWALKLQIFIKNSLLQSVTYETKVLQFGSWMRSLELQLYLGFFWFPLCIWFMQIRIDNLQRYKVAGKTINMVSLIKLQVYLSSFKIYLMKSNKGWSISIGLLYNWGIHPLGVQKLFWCVFLQIS